LIWKQDCISRLNLKLSQCIPFFDPSKGLMFLRPPMRSLILLFPRTTTTLQLLIVLRGNLRQCCPGSQFLFFSTDFAYVHWIGKYPMYNGHAPRQTGLWQPRTSTRQA
jgi:hypothetical protein